MKLQIYTSFLLSLFFVTITCQGQVTVGSTAKPEDFSSLQLNSSNGGLRLPQLSVGQRDALVIDETSAGLIIYNETSKAIEYWDGLKWSMLGDTIRVYNGIHKDGDIVKLGGNLEKATMVNLNSKNLEFATGAGNPGGFSVNDTVFVVNGRIVGAKPSLYTINKSALKVKETGSKVSIENQLKVKVKNDSMLVRNDSVNIHGQLYYDNNKSDINGKVLISKASGVAFWGKLKPDLILGKTYLKGKIKKAGTGTSTVWIQNTSQNISGPCISDTLTLTPGKWLIFSKFATKTNYASQKMFTWSHIFIPGQTVPTATIGADVEDATSTSSPELTYLIDVSANTKICVVASSSNNQTWLVEEDGTGAAKVEFGEPYFFAIMIEDYNEDE